MLPGQVNRQNLFSSFLATEDAAQSPAGLSPSWLVALWELVGIKHGVGHHRVCGHLGTFSSQLQAYLSGYCCREWEETEWKEPELQCGHLFTGMHEKQANKDM